MPVITRTERTVKTNAVDQPMSRGDGYEAPGRALMQLGDAIASAGKGLGRMGGSMEADLAAENKARDDFQFKMATTEFANDQELKLAQSASQLEDNGSTFMDDTTARYDTETADYFAKVPASRAEDAKLAATKLRGDIRMGAYKAGERRAITYYADETDRVITSYITGDRFDGSRASIDGALGASDAVINAAPIPAEVKSELKAKAARRIYDAWRAKADPSEARSVADEMFGTEAVPPEAAPPLDGPALKPAPGPDVTRGKGEINWQALTGALLPAGKPSPAGEPGDVIPLASLRAIAKRTGDTEAQAMSDAELQQLMKRPNVAKSFAYYYLEDLNKRYGNDVKAILIGYRSGTEVADAWLKAGRDDATLPPETRQMFAAMGIGAGTEPTRGGKLTTIEEMKAKAASAGVTDAEVISAPDVGDNGMEIAPPATGDEKMVIRPKKAAMLVPPKGTGGDTWSKLLGALIKQESGGHSGAESPVGASGVMQVMPGTAREIARELGESGVARMSNSQIKAWLKVRENGMRYGIYYLKKMLSRYNGDVAAALVAYNGGPGRGDKWLRSGRDDSVLPAETRGYYRNILRMMGKGGGVSMAALMGSSGGGAPSAVTSPSSLPVPTASGGLGAAPEMAGSGPMDTAGHFWGLVAGDYDRIKSADFAAERAREAEAAKALKIKSDEALKDGYDLISKGELTEDWLALHEPDMTPAQYRTFRKAMDNPGAYRTTEPQLYVELMNRADDEPGKVMAEATEALAERRITKEDWNRIYSATERASRPSEVSPYAKEALKIIRATAAPNLAYEADARAWMETIDLYHKAVEANPQMDAKEAQTLAEGLIKKYQLARTTVTRESLPWSKFFTSKREMVGEDDVMEALRKLNRAYPDKGAEFKSELTKIKKWHDYLKEEAKRMGVAR